MSTPILLLWSSAALLLGFALFYLLARWLNNYGIVDIVWSYAFAGLVTFFALGSAGWPMRRALFAAMVTVWSLRLGTHLFIRVAKHHPREDTRYAQLRRDWAGNFAPKMFGFFQLQAVSVLLLGGWFVTITQNAAPRLHALEIAGALLWLLALTGEALADAQLAAYKRAPAHRGRVCDVGLWRYSRHPNYFFEWLIWVGYFIFALASPWGWLGAIGPAAILYLLLCVTGVPLAEQQSLRSKGDAYRAYQARTSAFFPRPPRKPAAAKSAAKPPANHASERD